MSFTPISDPKYAVKDGKIINRASGEAIPDDEPMFIFRARDKHAMLAILDYADRVQNPVHKAIVTVCAGNFHAFAEQHPDRMKEPDSP